jgi:hypothetical protein
MTRSTADAGPAAPGVDLDVRAAEATASATAVDTAADTPADTATDTPAASDRSLAAGVVLWPIALLALVQVALRAALGPARDLDILWRAGGRLLAGGPLYDPDRAFIYPPVAGWALAPVAALPFRTAVVVMTVLSVAALVAAVVLLLDLVGIPARGCGAPGPAGRRPTTRCTCFSCSSRSSGRGAWWAPGPRGRASS